ncbi:TPA: LysR family transcriptional regulator [Serratia marcescens]|nr:LysR family transcriptional regulator [Serratia sp. FDAARGOS_506]HAT4982350.1 LysR family transcriptional regulator [Serratia marcescens]HAT5030533.1 LysR family transcriptional regulator [Serratia marcescens]
MDRITSMAIFVSAVEAGSFAGAAETLHISPQGVGKHVRSLEHWLGARLLHKTTRQQSLTEVGARFYERCKAVLMEVEAAEAVAQELSARPKGQLRIAAPLSFGHHQLVPLLPRFLEAYPEIHIDLHLSNRLVDVAEEGFDAVIRVPLAGDELLVSKRLKTESFCLCASPEYLARHGVPLTPEALADHQCLHGNWSANEVWQFQGEDRLHRIKVNSRLKINNWLALLNAARHGGGITLQPLSQVSGLIADGELVPLLPAYRIPVKEVSLLFLPDQKMPLKLRSFMDYVCGCFNDGHEA